MPVYKYRVFRSLGSIDEDVRKHELVAVEYGGDIDAVTGVLIRAVTDDATGLEKYQRFYDAQVHAPELVHSRQQVKGYDYVIVAVMFSKGGGEGEIIEYGITEETEIKPV